MTRLLLAAGSLLLPAALAGCAGCVSLDEGCASYDGVLATAPIVGDWDAVRFHDRMEPLYDEVRLRGDGAFIREEQFIAYVSVHPDPGGSEPWDGMVSVSLYSPDGRRSMYPDAAQERAREEWPGLREPYDRLVLDLAGLGLNVTSEPVIGCFCADH